MFELTVESGFSAAHALVVQGEPETLHGHDWRVSVTVAGPTLDRDGLLCDFHAIESALADVTGRLHNQNLNQIEPFDRLNPSAEHVAQHIAEELSRRLVGVLPAGVRLASVRVTEAPGCAAIYRPDEGAHASP